MAVRHSSPRPAQELDEGMISSRTWVASRLPRLLVGVLAVGRAMAAPAKASRVVMYWKCILLLLCDVVMLLFLVLSMFRCRERCLGFCRAFRNR